MSFTSAIPLQLFLIPSTLPHHPLFISHTHTIPPSWEGELEVWDEKKNGRIEDEGWKEQKKTRNTTKHNNTKARGQVGFLVVWIVVVLKTTFSHFSTSKAYRAVFSQVNRWVTAKGKWRLRIWYLWHYEWPGTKMADNWEITDNRCTHSFELRDELCIKYIALKQ